MKTYTFKITTVRFEHDTNSPHTIASFEFQAEDKKKALKYMFSLRKHFDENRPYFVLNYPLNDTSEEDLKEKY